MKKMGDATNSLGVYKCKVCVPLKNVSFYSSEFRIKNYLCTIKDELNKGLQRLYDYSYTARLSLYFLMLPATKLGL